MKTQTYALKYKKLYYINGISTLLKKGKLAEWIKKHNECKLSMINLISYMMIWEFEGKQKDISCKQ